MITGQALGRALQTPSNGATNAPVTPFTTSQSQTTNPYPNGITIPGTGANGSSTTYQDFWDPTIGAWAIKQGADGAIAPIETGQQWKTGNLSATGLGSNEVAQGGTLHIANKGGGSTDVVYGIDPTTGYAIPQRSVGNGQASWWQSTGLPILGGAAAIGAAALGAPELLGAVGGAGTADAGLTAADLAVGGTSLADASAALPAIDLGTAGAGAAGAGAAGAGASTAFGMSPGAASFDPGYSAMINGTANAGTDASTMGYGAIGSPGSAAFPGTGIPSGITGSTIGSTLSNALSNPQLVGKALSALGNVAGLGGSGASGGGGGLNIGALQGAIGGGVTPAQMVGGNNNQKLAQMLLQTPNGEGVI